MITDAQDERFDVRDAPSTRYQGSKRKILPWIWEHLRRIDFESVLDVFGGTGSVSYLLKRMGKQVTFNDTLKWNYLIGTALIENDHITLSDGELEMLTKPVIRSERGFVSNTFRGMYFTERENLWIDSVISRIARLSGTSQEIKYKSAIAHYALFQTCLVKRPFNLFHRANLGIRLADVSRSFGNKVTWEKPFAVHLRVFAAEANRFVFTGNRRCRAINFDAGRIPKKDYDLIYLDPPYLKVGKANETANYLHCYHFLEGLARYHEWPKLINRAQALLGISAKEVNPWIDTNKNSMALGNLLEKHRASAIAISCKKYGRPSIETIVRLLKRLGKQVSVHTRHYKYALNQQNGSAKLNRECLIIGV